MCMFLLGTRIGSNCTTDEDCKVVENAICDPAETCRCDRAHFASDTDTECIPGNINVADTILQMMIFEQLCRQKLEESCQNDNVSYIQKSIYCEGRWSCSK